MLLLSQASKLWSVDLQAGHFGQAPFDPLELTTDYNRQAEVYQASAILALAMSGVISPVLACD